MDNKDSASAKLEKLLPTHEATSGYEYGNLKRKEVSLLNVMRDVKHRQALFALIPTLTLGIIGGSVLPLAWAFSVTGIISGMVIIVVVALANAYTCDLLLRQAHVTSTSDYETLAFVIGGKWWKLATEVSIIILMVGSLIASFIQIGEVSCSGLVAIWPHLPNWLVGDNGRLIITLSVFLIVAPLCLGNTLRELEYAGIIGTAIVVWLMASVMMDSISNGLPAIANKELDVVGFNNIGSVTQAVSIFGFAFYIQPIMMPMLSEVPDGLIGVKIVSYSTRITVLMNAFLIYIFVGFFGAANYGKSTASNILENEWIGGGIAQGVLNLSMAVYLAISNPCLEFPTRHTIEGLISKKYFRNKFLQHVTITFIVLVFSLLIALTFPKSSAKVLVVTGATGVCMVSYLIPIVNHLILHFNRSMVQSEASLEGGESLAMVMAGDNEQGGYRNHRMQYRQEHNQTKWSIIVEISRDVVLPIVVLGVGVFCSVASLSTLGQS